jgi:hypothetical protein
MLHGYQGWLETERAGHPARSTPRRDRPRPPRRPQWQTRAREADGDLGKECRHPSGNEAAVHLR